MRTSNNTAIRRPRGSITKEGSVLLTVWVPEPIAARLAEAVKTQDTDRSKLLRRAIRRELENATV